jgi:hypothetical protein
LGAERRALGARATGRRFDAAARRHEHFFHCSTLQVSMFIDNVFGGFVNTSMGMMFITVDARAVGAHGD